VALAAVWVAESVELLVAGSVELLVVQLECLLVVVLYQWEEMAWARRALLAEL